MNVGSKQSLAITDRSHHHITVLPVECDSRNNCKLFISNHWLAVWLSGNALTSINVVVLCQTRLVSGWVTVCGRVNHLGM